MFPSIKEKPGRPSSSPKKKGSARKIALSQSVPIVKKVGRRWKDDWVGSKSSCRQLTYSKSANKHISNWQDIPRIKSLNAWTTVVDVEAESDMSSSFQKTQQLKKAAAKKGDLLVIRAKKLAAKLSVDGESILKLLEEACTEYHTAEDYGKVNEAVCMHARILGDRAVARITQALNNRDYERCVHLLTEAKGHYSILSRESGKHSSNSRERDLTAEKELNEDAQRVSSTRNPHSRVVSMVRKAIAQEIHQANVALRILDYTKALELVQHAMRSDSWLVKLPSSPEEMAAEMEEAKQAVVKESDSDSDDSEYSYSTAESSVIGNEPWTQVPGFQHEELLELRRLIFDTQQVKISVELEGLLQQSDLETNFDLKKVLSLLETAQERYSSVIDGPLRNRKLRLIRSMTVETKIALSAKNNAKVIKAHEGKESPTQQLRRLAQNTSKKGDDALLEKGMEILSFINAGLFGIQQNIDENPYGLNEVALLTQDLAEARNALGRAMVTLVQWAFAPSTVTIEEASLAAKALQEDADTYSDADADDDEEAFDRKMLILMSDGSTDAPKRPQRRKSSYERMLSSKDVNEAGDEVGAPTGRNLNRQMSKADFASVKKTGDNLKEMRRLSLKANEEHRDEFERQKAAHAHRRSSSAPSSEYSLVPSEADVEVSQYACVLRAETQEARDSLKRATMTMQVESKRVQYAYGQLYDRDVETRKQLRTGQLLVTRRMVEAMKHALADVDEGHGGVGGILASEDGVVEHVAQAEKALDVAQAAVDTSEDWTSEEDLMCKLKEAEKLAEGAKKRALEASQVIFKKQSNLQREARSKREELQRAEIRDGLLREAEEKMDSLIVQTEKGPYGLLTTPVVSKSFGKTKLAIVNARKALEHSVELSSDEAADRGLESLKRRTVTVHHKVQQAEMDMQSEWRRLEQERAKREIRGERERRRLLSGPLNTAEKEVKRAQKLTVTILSSFVMKPAALEEVKAAEKLRADAEAKAAAAARKKTARRKRMARGGNVDEDAEEAEEAEEAAALLEAEKNAAEEYFALKDKPSHWKYIPPEVKAFNEQVVQMAQQLVAVHEIASEPVDTKYASTMETCLQLLTLQVNDILDRVARTLEKAGSLTKQIVSERKERAIRDTETRAKLRHMMGGLKKRLLSQVGNVARHRDNLCSLQCVKDCIKECEQKMKKLAGLLWVPSEVATEQAVQARLIRLETMAQEAEKLVVETEKIVSEEGRRLLQEMDRRRAHESLAREKLREQLEAAMQVQENAMFLPGVTQGKLLEEKLVKHSLVEYNEHIPKICEALNTPVNTRKSNKQMLSELDELKERTNTATSLASHFKIAAGRANKKWLSDQGMDEEAPVEGKKKKGGLGSAAEPEKAKKAPTLTSSIEISHTVVKEKRKHRRASLSKQGSQTMSATAIKSRREFTSNPIIAPLTPKTLARTKGPRYSVEANLAAEVLARTGRVLSGQVLGLELVAEFASGFENAKELKITTSDGEVTALVICNKYISALLFEAGKADDFGESGGVEMSEDVNQSLLRELSRRLVFDGEFTVDFPEPLTEEVQVRVLAHEEEAPILTAGEHEELPIDSFAEAMASVDFHSDADTSKMEVMREEDRANNKQAEEMAAMLTASQNRNINSSMARSSFALGMTGRNEAADASDALAMNTNNKFTQESQEARMKDLWSIEEQTKSSKEQNKHEGIDRAAVVRVQALQRRRVGRRARAKIMDERVAAMVQLQSLSRGYREKKEVAKLRQKVTNATVRIQSLMRQRQGRKTLNFMSAIKDKYKHKAAETIQRMVRAHMIGISNDMHPGMAGNMANIAAVALQMARKQLREEQDMNQKQLDEEQRLKEAAQRKRELGQRLCNLTPRFLCQTVLTRIKNERESHALERAAATAALLMGSMFKGPAAKGPAADNTPRIEEQDEEVLDDDSELFPHQTQMRHTFDSQINRKGSMELINLGNAPARSRGRQPPSTPVRVDVGKPSGGVASDEPRSPPPVGNALSEAKQDLSRRMRRTSFLTTRAVQARPMRQPVPDKVKVVESSTPKDEEWVFRKSPRTVVAVLRLKIEGIDSLFSDKRNLSRLEHMFRRKSSARLFKPPQESELQTYLLGLLYTPVLEAVDNHGGDVFDYSTDCMTFVWKASSFLDSVSARDEQLHKVGQLMNGTKQDDDEDPEDELIQRGLQAATTMAARCMANIRTCLTEFRENTVLHSGSSTKKFFHIRMVLGAGPVHMVQLGGTLSRWECMLNGQPTDQILTIESLLDVLASAKFQDEVAADVTRQIENEKRRRSSASKNLIQTRRSSFADRRKSQSTEAVANAAAAQKESAPFGSRPTADENAEMEDSLAQLGGSVVNAEGTFEKENDDWKWCKCVLSRPAFVTCNDWVDARRLDSLTGANSAAASLVSDGLADGGKRDNNHR
jgi:hypothetical protein